MIQKIYNFFIDIIQTIVLAFSIFLIVYAWLFRPFEVSGKSMHPTFHDGEYVITNLIGLKFNNLNRGDVIVFKAPKDKDKDFIKRIIGLPGDKIKLLENEIYINDKKINESAYLGIDIKTSEGIFLKEGSSITVPSENYFVCGDNREYSSDSREWGFVTKEAIIGKSIFVYWPQDRLRIINNPFKE
ncbi:signal peptidase I [Candidatus Levyibacteriota bacterium]|nr:signal peptidase I [Candidatus Levybacteria bacterium]MSU25865.1 signal peptidase I [Candidatus Levybacteria bacterium]GDX61907.1 signal peptidase I [Candidatus Levybacteria bacterium]